MDVLVMLPQFSCSRKTELSSPLNPDSSTNATPFSLVLFPWLWIMQWLFNTYLNISLRPNESYSLSFEQPHASPPPTFWSHCHCPRNFLPNIYLLTPFHSPFKPQFESYFVSSFPNFNSWVSDILETSPNCCLSQVEFSEFSLCLITILFSTLHFYLAILVVMIYSHS